MAMRTTLDSHYTYAVEIACCVGDLCHSNASNNVRKKGGGGGADGTYFSFTIRWGSEVELVGMN